MCHIAVDSERFQTSALTKFSQNTHSESGLAHIELRTAELIRVFQQVLSNVRAALRQSESHLCELRLASVHCCLSCVMQGKPFDEVRDGLA